MTTDSGDHGILIVEDEPMLAYAVQESLLDAGFIVAGVAGTLESALAIIDSGVCDAAILDANLRGVSAAPAASALAARAIPFIVLSGYSLDQQEAAFADAPHLQKPCRPERLIQALRDVLPVRSIPAG